MKFLLKTVILVLSLICVLLLIALFLPKDYRVERSIHIEQAPSDLYEYLRYLENQEEFSPWLELDSEMDCEILGEDGEVGAIAKWNSPNQKIGKGQLEILTLTPDSRIESNLVFSQPWEAEVKSYFALSTKAGKSGTKVSWGFEGESPWPWNISLLFMDLEEEFGRDLDKGLKKLKKIQEEEDL